MADRFAIGVVVLFLLGGVLTRGSWPFFVGQGVLLGTIMFQLAACYRGRRQIADQDVLLCWVCSYPKGAADQTVCSECGQFCTREEELALWRFKYGPKVFSRCDHGTAGAGLQREESGSVEDATPG